MRTVLTAAFLAIIAGQVYAQIPTGTIIIYRQRGANFGLLHYAQGESNNLLRRRQSREIGRDAKNDGFGRYRTTPLRGE